jgi:Ala-tRNA(Pro) deacylase
MITGTELRVDVTSFLDEAGVDFDVLEHGHTERAAEEAAVLGVALDEVAKTLVLGTPEGNVRAVLPASERVDLGKVGELVGASGKKVQLVSEDDLARDYGEFELGAVPPFGGKADPVIVDRRLGERDWVVVEAGSHQRSVRMKTTDLVRLTEAQIADICAEER